eukprot:7705222-Pyramimonas_sp.AAC.1
MAASYLHLAACVHSTERERAVHPRIVERIYPGCEPIACVRTTGRTAPGSCPRTSNVTIPQRVPSVTWRGSGGDLSVKSRRP